MTSDRFWMWRLQNPKRAPLAKRKTQKPSNSFASEGTALLLHGPFFVFIVDL